MQCTRIPKKNGKSRLIFMPNRNEKTYLRGLVVELEEMARNLAPPGVVHGFTAGRNPVTNAERHIGFQYSLCFDMEDFFDTVTRPMLAQYLSFGMADKITVNHPDKPKHAFTQFAGQGLPTSPSAANLACSKLDWELFNFCQALGVVYTRYADDMTFSFNDYALYQQIRQFVEETVPKHNFKINPNKTHLQSAKRGRRNITGVAVDDKQVYPTRESKRRLRAARHQQRRAKARGLEEWCKVKKPLGFICRINRRREVVIEALAPYREPGKFIYFRRNEASNLQDAIQWIETKLKPGDPTALQIIRRLRPKAIERSVQKMMG